MPEPVFTPFCIALAAGFAGKLIGFGTEGANLGDDFPDVVGGAGGDAVGSLIKNLFHRASDSTLDPATGLPRNHDLQRASRDSLREAVLVLSLELAGQLDPKKPWIPALIDHVSPGGLFRVPLGQAWKNLRNGKLFTVPLSQARHDPVREWFEAFQDAVAGDAFDQWHDGLRLNEDDIRECFQGGQCHLAAVFTQRLLTWVRRTVNCGQEPPGFAALVTTGWEIPGGTGRITLEQAYCLFFREHLKHRPEVFRIYVADTLGELLKRQGNAITKTDFATFEQWIEPQLGELKSLLGDIAVQVRTVAAGQKELSGQQDQMLVALVAIQTEVRRGNAEAVSEMRQLRGWLDQRLTAIGGSVSRTERNTELILDRLEPGKPHRPPFDRLPIVRAGELIGRVALLRDLVARLRRREDVCVTGGPGFGKTALAVTALREVIGETDEDLARSPFPDGLVFLELYQLEADPDRVWTRLADAFAPGLHPTLVPRDRAARACANVRALVMVEGAEEAGDGAALQELLAVLGTQVRRLILTRNAAQDATGRPLRVDRELARDDALRLLRLLSPTRGTDDQLEAILGLLGGSPLALTHAGLQLANPEDSPIWFLQELKAALLDKVCEPGNEKHPLRWLYDRSWRLVSDDARRVWAGCGNLAYGPFAEGVAEACLRGTEPASPDRGRGALRQLVRHGILSPPDDAERWLFSHALAYRYAGLRADPALRLPLARWVVAEFRRCLERFESSQQPRPVADLLAHASGLLATEANGTGEVAAVFEDLVDAMPQPGGTVLLAPHLAAATGELFRSVVRAAEARQDGLNPLRAKFAGTLSNWFSQVGRRAEALAPAQEAVELYRALAGQNADAYTPDLAISLGTLGWILESGGHHEVAWACFRESLKQLGPVFLKLPAAYASWASFMCNNYVRVLAQLGREPDYDGGEAFLIPVMEVLRALKAQTPPEPAAGE